MLKLRLLKQDIENAMYNYYPDGESEFGTISINKKTGEIGILQTAENDEFGIYKIHAIQRIKEYFTKQVFQEQDIVAWC